MTSGRHSAMIHSSKWTAVFGKRRTAGRSGGAAWPLDRLVLSAVAVCGFAGAQEAVGPPSAAPRLAAASSPAAKQPGFEVVSVKLGTPIVAGSRHPIPRRRADPGLLTLSSYTLPLLISQAYGIEPRQISSKENWLDDVTYDIVAKPERPSSPSEYDLMLRDLLADRFHLTFHWDRRRMPVYSLVVAKGGPRLKKAEEGATRPASLVGRISVSTLCKLLAGSSATEFTAAVDKTAITGLYDFSIPADPTSRRPALERLAEALPRQFGLELRREVGELDVLTIDTIDRKPKEN